MPALLLLSPMILDQSFPRSVDELERVGATLGGVESLIAANKCVVVATDLLTEFIADFYWGEDTSHSTLIDIHRLLNQLLMRDDCYIRLNLGGTDQHTLHPLPATCAPSGLSGVWQEEAGRVLTLHMQRLANGAWCIGIPCDLAFVGRPLGTYTNPEGLPHFPLVQTDLSELINCENWVVDDDDIRGVVTVARARKNLRVLNGTVKKPSGGSHYKVSFPKAPRPWILDPNDDPVPDAYLSQLPDLCGFPIRVVKYALMCGKLPARRSVFEDVVI